LISVPLHHIVSSILSFYIYSHTKLFTQIPNLQTSPQASVTLTPSNCNRGLQSTMQHFHCPIYKYRCFAIIDCGRSYTFENWRCGH